MAIQIRPIPDAAVTMAKHFEGLHDGNKYTPLIEPYHDPIGLPTVGYGHLLSPVPWADLSQWPALTVDECEELLVRDLRVAAVGVMRYVKVPLTDNQYAALVDFVFNAGGGRLKASTLLRKVNEGNHNGAALEFQKWVYAGGQKLPGLIRRRAAEAKLYLS